MKTYDVNLTAINQGFIDIFQGKIKPVEKNIDEASSDIMHYIYKVDNVYIKLSYMEDSYGSTSLQRIQFVEPKKVEITNFEPI